MLLLHEVFGGSLAAAINGLSQDLLLGTEEPAAAIVCEQALLLWPLEEEEDGMEEEEEEENIKRINVLRKRSKSFMAEKLMNFLL